MDSSLRHRAQDVCTVSLGVRKIFANGLGSGGGGGHTQEAYIDIDISRNIAALKISTKKYENLMNDKI